ncbi:retrovirus-related pol polyprotein from transposon TNT 1-94 [Tanacetum coccineum]
MVKRATSVPNGDALRKCILEGPYTPSTVIILVVPATDNSLAVPERTTVETVLNMSPENKAHFESEKEAIHLILTRIGDEIYSTVDAFNELRAERIAKHANLLALVAAAQPHQDPYYQTSKSHKSYPPTSKALLLTRSHATTRHKGKEIAKPITPPSESASEEDSDHEQAKKDKEMQKNLALIAKYFKKIYKPTNNNLRTSSNTKNKNVDTILRYKNDNQTGQKPKRVKDSTYHKEKMLLCKQAEKGVPLQAEQSDWLADTDEEIDEQELEAYYSYMAKIQEVPIANSGNDFDPLKHVQYDTGYNVFANEIQFSEQFESISNTCVVEMGDSNVIPDLPDMYDNDNQNDQNVIECADERVALANLIANLKLDVDENKKIQKKLKKANASLTQELTECKSILAETSRTLGESNSIRDSCLVALQNKQIEFERYKTLNGRTVDYEKLEHKLNETLGLLAQKDIDIKEGLKLKAYEISVVKEKHNELVKQSLVTKSHYEGLVKEKTKVITDLKLKEEKYINKVISIEKQLKFLNEIVYKISQSIQTIHMLAPKCPIFNGRPTFANPMCLKKALNEKPCLYEIPHDQSDPANRLVPKREEILTLEVESRYKLNKDLVKPYDYTKLNSLYEIFKPPTQEYLVQLAHANENDSFVFVHELKQEMHVDLKYVESLKQEIDELESDKVEFSNMYDMLLQECVSNDVMSSYLHLLSDLDAHTELQFLYLHKVKECECLAQKLSKQTEFVSKEIVQLILFIVDSGCTKYMTGNLTLLCNFVEKYLGTVRFGNDQFAPILGYGDMVQGNITINRRSSGKRFTHGNRGSDLYSISLQETTLSTPICLMAKASTTQVWLWHRRLSHLNFDYINLLLKKDVVIGLPKLKYVKDQLRSSCEVSKAKRSSFKTKTVPSLKGQLNLLHMDLCGPMRVASINRKKYMLKSSSPVISVRTNRGAEFLNKTLNAFFKEEGIEHQTFTPRTPEQNGVVERRNHTLVKAARTMLSASKLPLFFWAEAIATACYTQNR